MGGTIPVRFPHDADPGDAGWHVESSFPTAGGWHTNVRSKGRGLLALFLLTDVGPADAPTRVRVGSHTDAATVLAGAGEAGLGGAELSPLVDRASADRPTTYATGAAGDVYLCHPFLVHEASWPHRGSTPRIIAQPGVALLEPFRLTDRAGTYPVEAAILGRAGRLTRQRSSVAETAGEHLAEAEIDRGGQAVVHHYLQFGVVQLEQVAEEPGQGVRRVGDEVDEAVGPVRLEDDQHDVQDENERGDDGDEPDQRGDADAGVPSGCSRCGHG